MIEQPSTTTTNVLIYPGSSSDDAKDCDKLKIVSIASLLSEAIRRINNEESVSSLFV